MSNILLTKSSSESDLKRYFTAVLELSHNDNKFPINLDEVWPLVYGRRDNAIRELRKTFFENEDYKVIENYPLPQNEERSSNGQFNGSNKISYFLSLSCMEYFIARKVRPVFEVYRQVFHRTAQSVTPSYQIEDPVKRAEKWIEEQKTLALLKQQNETLAPKARVYDQVIGNAQDSSTFTTRQVAQEIGMTDQRLYAILMQINVLYRQSDTYMLYSDYLKWGLHKMTSHVIDPEKGRVRTYLKWTNRGRAYIHALHDTQWDKRRACHLLKKGTDTILTTTTMTAERRAAL